MNWTEESSNLTTVFIKNEPLDEPTEQVKTEDNPNCPLSDGETKFFLEKKEEIFEDPPSSNKEPTEEEQKQTRAIRKRRVIEAPTPMFQTPKKRRTVKASLPRLSVKPLSILQTKNNPESEFCYVCVDNIAEGSSFKEHFDQMHQDSSDCIICGASSSSFPALLTHLNTHSLSCNECNETFLCRKEALLHHKYFHSSILPHSISNFDSSSLGIVKFEQEQVKKRTDVRTVVSESKPGTMVIQKPSQNSTAKHVCAMCMKGFRTRQHLRRHEFTHREKPEICKQCCLSFDSLDELKDHRIKVHAGNLSWICEICGLAYGKYLSYREHVKKVHFGEKKVYKCELCDKVLANSNIYKTHLRTHSGEKPFECATCGKSYYDKYSLTKHEKLHKTQLVYKCSLCDKTYNRSCLLSEHIKWSHAITVEAELNNFKCSVCDLELGNADCYWQHVYNHSSQDPGSILQDPGSILPHK